MSQPEDPKSTEPLPEAVAPEPASAAADPAPAAADPAPAAANPAPQSPPLPPAPVPAPAFGAYPAPGFGPAAPMFDPYAQRYDPTFAPVPRPPRSRWIAPHRKAAVVAISIVSALLLLGIGALGGSLLTGHNEPRGRPAFDRNGFSRLIPARPGGQGFGPQRVRPSRPNAPAPAPTPTATS